MSDRGQLQAKMMLVVDEHIDRKYLAIEVKRSISGEHIVKTMTYLFREREASGLIHSEGFRVHGCGSQTLA